MVYKGAKYFFVPVIYKLSSFRRKRNLLLQANKLYRSHGITDILLIRFLQPFRKGWLQFVL